MSRIRVLDLAKELGLDTKTTIVKLQELGVVVKNHFNAISDAEADKLRGLVKTGKVPDKDGGKPAAKVLIRRRASDSPREGEGASGEHYASEPSRAESSPHEIMNEQPSSYEPVEPVVPVVEPAVVAEPAPQEAVSRPIVEPVAPPPPAPQPVVEEREIVRSQPEVVAAQPVVEAPKNVEPEPQPVEAVRPEPRPELPPAHAEVLSEVSSGTPEAPARPDPVPRVETAAPRAEPQPPRPEPVRTTPPPAQPQQRPSTTSATIVQRAPQPPPPAEPAPRPQSQGVQATQRPPSAGGFSAVVVRRGASEQQGQQPQQGQSMSAMGSAGRTYTRPAGGGLVSGERRQGWSQGGTGRPGDDQQRGPRTYEASGDRPGYYGGGAGRPGAPGMGPRGPRTEGEGFDRGGNRGGPRPSAFVMPDALGKDGTIRRTIDKDRDKDKVRRSTVEEENARRAQTARVKGRHEDDPVDFEPEDYVLEESEENTEAVNVRTVYTPLPNRRRGSGGAKKKELKRREAPNPTKASKKVVRVDESISVSDLAAELSVKGSAVIKALMQFGVMAGINQVLDFDTATLVAQEFGFETQNTTVNIGDILSRKTADSSEVPEVPRAPVVTVMGHVDHGKTSLLDAIRAADVASGEAGGITQHIGAYQVECDGRRITFLDTPGHEAFTAMRARGAQVTDIVVLVVAADDGVMPQTVEAINHAKSANVPIVVAINKIDKQGVNLDRILRELADHGVMSEEWGGDSMFIKVSAKTKQGVPELLEAIVLQSEVLDLRARRDVNAAGVVIEAKLDKARGPVATVIVTQGILRPQDSVVAGVACGRVRAIFSDKGERLAECEPSMPVEILGLDEVPAAGDQFNVVANDDVAKEAVAYRIKKQREKDLAGERKATLEELLARMSQGESQAKELPLILKADTQGSVEAIRATVQKLSTEKVKTKIIHGAVGGITETDVTLAKAANAVVVGFNVRPDRVAASVAEKEGVDLRFFSIIYELVESVQAAMAGRLAPIRTEKTLGRAEVRNLFSVPKVGIIAGTSVTDGKITRNGFIRVVRDGTVVYSGRVGSLKRFKEDAKEVLQGFECGVGVENFNDLKVGDVLESYIIEETAATLN